MQVFILRAVCNYFPRTGFTPYILQSKTIIRSTNIDQKSLETEFSIVICRPTGDKWQSKTLILAIFDPRSSIVSAFLIAAYLVCFNIPIKKILLLFFIQFEEEIVEASLFLTRKCFKAKQMYKMADAVQVARAIAQVVS